MTTHASRRLRQIENELYEQMELIMTPGLLGNQKATIASMIRALLVEREDLESGNHYLSGTKETKPSMKAVQDAVQRDIHNGFANKGKKHE